jgi:hypothetical protein
MPYEIVTKDGITVQNIPDDVQPDSPILKKRVADIRAARDAAPTEQTKPQQAPGIGDKLLGAGEAALSMLTAPIGAVGAAIGTGAGLIESIANGTYGTQAGAKAVEQRAAQAMAAGTYMPRTESGQGMVRGIGEALSPLQAMGPAGAMGVMTVNAAGMPARASTQLFREQALPAVTQSVRNPVQAVRQTVGMGSQAEKYAGGAATANMGAAAASIGNQARSSVAGASPELRLAVEKALRNGEDLNMSALSRHAEAESLPVKIRLTEGQATGSLEQISNERNMRAKNPAYAEHFNAQDGQLKDNLAAIRETATPDVYAQDATSHGETLIGAYKAKDDAAKADIRAKYQALADANGGQLPIDSATFVDNAERGLQKVNRSRFVPAEVRGLLDDFKGGAPMTFDDFEQLRTILSAEARKADQAGDGNRSMAVSAVRNALEDLPMPRGREDLKPLADAARSAAKARFDAIRSDPAYSAVVKGKALPDSFGNRFVVNADSTNVAKMMGGLDGDPVAQQTLSAILLDHLSDRAGVRNGNGAFAQAGFGKALDKQKSKLAIVMPREQVNQLSTLGDVARYVKDQPHGAWVNNSNTFVSQAGSKAATAIEGVANVAAGGVPVGTWTRSAVDKRFGAQAFQKSIAPGAGIVKTKQQRQAEIAAKVKAASDAKKQNKSF